MLERLAPLDLVFRALADPVRRGLVERLVQGPKSVSELAKPLAMSLAAVLQHLQVLEASGLVQSEKVGRIRTCRLEADALALVEQWLGARRQPHVDAPPPEKPNSKGDASPIRRHIPFRGFIDHCSANRIIGWLMWEHAPLERIECEVLFHGVVIARGIADQFRLDVKEAGFGDGSCGFSIPLPEFMATRDLRQVVVRPRGADALILQH